MVADAISRRPDSASAVPEQDTSPQAESPERDRLERECESCADFLPLVAKCTGVDSTVAATEPSTVSEGGKEYEWQEKYLWVRTKAGRRAAVSRNSSRREIFAHSLVSHPGVERTVQTVRQLRWWPQVTEGVLQSVRSCFVCTKGKASNLKAGRLLQPSAIPPLRWGEIAMDLIGAHPEPLRVGMPSLPLLPPSKDGALCVNCPTGHSEGNCVLVIEGCYTLTWSTAIVSDRGTRCTSEVWQHMGKRLSIQLNMSPPCHPQAERKKEIYHGTNAALCYSRG